MFYLIKCIATEVVKLHQLMGGLVACYSTTLGKIVIFILDPTCSFFAASGKVLWRLFAWACSCITILVACFISQASGISPYATIERPLTLSEQLDQIDRQLESKRCLVGKNRFILREALNRANQLQILLRTTSIGYDNNGVISYEDGVELDTYRRTEMQTAGELQWEESNLTTEIDGLKAKRHRLTLGVGARTLAFPSTGTQCTRTQCVKWEDPFETPTVRIVGNEPLTPVSYLNEPQRIHKGRRLIVPAGQENLALKNLEPAWQRPPGLL